MMVVRIVLLLGLYLSMCFLHCTNKAKADELTDVYIPVNVTGAY